MKTIGKLKINPDRLIKNEELKSFKGGECSCHCYAQDNMIYLGCLGYTGSWESCAEICTELYLQQYWDVESSCN
jgi:hypothetical protein